MAERSFQGSTGIVGAVVPGVLAAIAVLAGGLYALQVLKAAPVLLLVPLVLAVLVCLVVVKAIGTDATWSIEPDALVRDKRGTLRRYPYTTFDQLSFFPYDELQRTPHILVTTKTGAMLYLWAKEPDQGPELEAFCALLKERAGK